MKGKQRMSDIDKFMPLVKVSMKPFQPGMFSNSFHFPYSHKKSLANTCKVSLLIGNWPSISRIVMFDRPALAALGNVITGMLPNSGISAALGRFSALVISALSDTNGFGVVT